MKEKIINYAIKIGIDDIGFTKYEKITKMPIKKDIPFSSKQTEIISDANTIISIVLSYPKTSLQLENISDNYVYFSSSSWGNDYHKVLKQKLELLSTFIKKQVSNFNYQILIDNHSLDDRYIAYLAGLGFYGKNNLLFHNKYGSYIFIGNMITNLNLKEDYPQKKMCLNCMKCINACPTKALTKNGYNYKKCLSYLTQKQELTQKEEELLNNCIYGCDICGKICPLNSNNNTNQSSFLPTNIEFIDVNKYQSLSNKKFNQKYGHLSAAWRSKKIIERNINIYKDKIN